jgi:hypothetical protein
MQERWAAFGRDPEWIEARRESETGGPLVARISRRVLNTAVFEPRQGS